MDASRAFYMYIIDSLAVRYYARVIAENPKRKSKKCGERETFKWEFDSYELQFNNLAANCVGASRFGVRFGGGREHICLYGTR